MGLVFDTKQKTFKQLECEGSWKSDISRPVNG